MFGVLRTFIRRMYHARYPEHLPEYVAEFASDLQLIRKCSIRPMIIYQSA